MLAMFGKNFLRACESKSKQERVGLILIARASFSFLTEPSSGARRVRAKKTSPLGRVQRFYVFISPLFVSWSTL